MKALTARVSVLRAQMMATSAHVPLPIQRWGGGCAGWARAGRVSAKRRGGSKATGQGRQQAPNRAAAGRAAGPGGRPAPHLAPVEHPAALHAAGSGGQRRGVAAVGGLGQGPAPDLPAGAGARGRGGWRGSGGAAVGGLWDAGSQARPPAGLPSCRRPCRLAMRGALHAAARKPPPPHAPPASTRQHPPEPRHVAQQLPLLRLAAQQAHCREGAGGGGGQAGRGQAGGSALGWRRSTRARLRRSEPTPQPPPLPPCRCPDAGGGSGPRQRRAPRGRARTSGRAPHP